MSGRTIAVKTYIRDDVRRFSVPSPPSFAALTRRTAEAHGLPEAGVSGIAFSWRDGDGDDVTIASDDDLQEALSWATGTLKLFVRRRDDEAQALQSALGGDAWALAGGPGGAPQALTPVVGAGFSLDPTSAVGTVVGRVVEHFCLPLPLSNPKLLEMFRDRDRTPPQPLLPWSGEFVGKYLTHCVQLHALAGGDALAGQIASCLATLFKYQATDGYIGPWPSGFEFKQGAPNCATPWDSWGHYHVMCSALLWHRSSGDSKALQFAERIAAKLVDAFGGDPHKLYACGALEQNCAILHSVASLYAVNKDPALLDLCRTILQEWQLPPGGDYLRNALKGQPFYKGTQPRWEGLISIMGLAELFWATGEGDYSTGYQQIWWSLCECERHNHGGLMSGEQATGSPYNTGSVETCCTVTWAAMCVEMLKLTGDSVVADELELTLYNTAILAESPSGRWCVYNSCMTGQKESTTIEIAFQARCGSSELSCCSVNGPRLFGLASEWAVMLVPGTPVPTVAVNLYGTVASAAVPKVVTLEQATAYPLDPMVKITVTPVGPPEMELWFRVPAWSEKTTASVNGAAAPAVPSAGTYLKLRRTWTAGDVVTLTFDFRLRAWAMGADDAERAEPGASGASPALALHPSTAVGAAAAGGGCGLSSPRATLLAPAAPVPVWDSSRDGKWPSEGKSFAGDASEMVVIGAGGPALGNKPSTMLCWVATGMSELSDNIPVSCGAGAKATPNMSRALGLQPANANYYLGGSANDMLAVIDAARATAWKAAMSSLEWHHVAVSDDGETMTLFLDGAVVGSRPVKDPARATAGGFMVGGWADRNRYFAGVLSGVQFYTAALSAADVAAAMSATRPRGEPSFPTYVSLYRGPLLLGFDPRFNTGDSPAPLAADKLARKPATTDSWIQPSLLLEFEGADGTPVVLCDCGSLGVTGLAYTTWLETSFGGGAVPSAPFSHTNPTRTFFLE